MEDIARNRKGKNPYKEEEILFIFISLVDAFYLMKQNMMAHCDVKPDNIFFSAKSDNPKVYVYKLGDFGICQVLEDEEIFPLTSIDNLIGYSELWASPEVKNIADLKNHEISLQNKFYDPFKADIFSLALTIIFMINLDQTEIKQFQKNQNLSKFLEPIKSNYKKLAPFLEKMLATNPEDRISFDDLKKDLESYKKDAHVPDEDKFMERSIK